LNSLEIEISEVLILCLAVGREVFPKEISQANTINKIKT